MLLLLAMLLVTAPFGVVALLDDRGEDVAAVELGRHGASRANLVRGFREHTPFERLIGGCQRSSGTGV